MVQENLFYQRLPIDYILREKRRWFIRLGTGVTTVLGGMAGNYFGEAIASIYASGGASATTLNTGVAKMFTKYARGTIKESNRGIGWNIKFKKYAWPDEFIKHGSVEELEKIYCDFDSILEMKK